MKSFKKVIRRESYVFTYQFNSENPIFTVNNLHFDVLRDQTKILNSPFPPTNFGYFNFKWADYV